MVNSPMIDTTVYDRNRIGDLTRIIEPWGGQRQWTRDGSGRLESSTDSSGRTRTYTHDAMGRRTTFVATGGGGAPLTSLFTFDANGRRLSSTLGATMISQVLDPDGQLLARSSTSPQVTETYARWPESGQLAGVTSPVGTLQLIFDEAEALKGYVLGEDTIVGLRFTDDAGRLTLEWNPPTLADAEAFLDQQPPPSPTHLADLPPIGRAVERTWGNGRLLSLALRHGSMTVHSRTYTHALDGRVSGFTDSQTGTTTYGYDDAGWLVSTTTPEHTWSWTYDTAGNRLTETVDGTTTTATLAQGNRVTSLVSPLGTVTMTYDAMARLVSRSGAPVGGTWTYAWDPMGRLAEVVRPDGVHASYRYDTWGDRVEKTVGGVTTRFYRSGWLFLELDAQDQLLRTTMFAGDGTTPLWVTQGSTVAFVHVDHLGTPIMLTTLDDQMVWHARYAPWGQAEVLVGGFDQPWRFPGQYYDAETGLHYNRQRYYDPTLGRYLSPDPIGHRGGWNTGAYVAGDSVNLADPTGQFYQGGCVLAGPLAPACFAAVSTAQMLGAALLALGVNALNNGGGGSTSPGSSSVSHDGDMCRATSSTRDKPDPCMPPMIRCLTWPWAPPGHTFGPRNDCSACYRECVNSGGTWPTYKCP